MLLLSFSLLVASVAAQNLVFGEKIRNGLDPFWYEIMIPVVLCLAVVLLIVSIFAVALITVRSIQDTDNALVSFVPPGFDSAWERNVKAELGFGNGWVKTSSSFDASAWSKSSQHDHVNSPIEIITVFPDENYSQPKLANENLQVFMPKPLMADNLTEIPFRQK